MKNYIIAGSTDVGRTRHNNEDSMITFECRNGHVVAVCDGMGGENGGETASNLAVAIIQDILTNNPFDTAGQAITTACHAANQGILHRAANSPELAGMGSTCVMAIINNGYIYYGSIGDSRIYYYTPGEGIVQLTKDQSYVQTLVDSGQITPEEAEHHPRKNEIINALGLEEMTPPVLGEQPIPVSHGGIMLLCSDGLSGMVPDITLQQILSRQDWTAQQKCDKLVNLANEAGGLDNITVQIIDCTAAASAGPRSVPRSAMAAAGSKSKKSAKKAGGKKSYAWIGILITALMICGAIFYIFLNNSSDKKDSNKGKSQVTITKEDGRGNVKVETVKEKKKGNPKPAPKTKPDNSKKDNNKGDNVGSKIKSGKGESDITPTSFLETTTNKNKEKKDVIGGGDEEISDK